MPIQKPFPYKKVYGRRAASRGGTRNHRGGGKHDPNRRTRAEDWYLFKHGMKAPPIKTKPEKWVKLNRDTDFGIF